MVNWNILTVSGLACCKQKQHIQCLRLRLCNTTDTFQRNYVCVSVADRKHISIVMYFVKSPKEVS